MITILKELPLYLQQVNAGATGFPSPADDSLETTLDINDYLRLNKDATFYCLCSGNSMKPVIEDEDILVVDRSIKAVNHSIVICTHNSERLVKQLYIELGKVELHSLNPEYPPIIIDEFSELYVFGVVKSVVRNLIRNKIK